MGYCLKTLIRKTSQSEQLFWCKRYDWLAGANCIQGYFTPVLAGESREEGETGTKGLRTMEQNTTKNAQRTISLGADLHRTSQVSHMRKTNSILFDSLLFSGEDNQNKCKYRD